MTELLTLILSDFKHFIGTLILMAWAGIIITVIIGTIASIIRPKKKAIE